MGNPLLFVLCVGGCVGSFLNVVVHRLPRGESLVWPGSRCPRCTTRLRPVDNIPLLSYLFLAARCRACGAPIATRYPVLEGLGGLVFVGAYLTRGLTLEAAVMAMCLALLIAVAVIDLDSFVIPDSLCLAIAAGGVSMAWVSTDGPSLESRLVAGVVGAGCLWALGVVSRGGMGLGDAKLVGAMGVFLGPKSVILAFAVASVLGATAGIVLLSTRRKRRGDPIPFGPFLVMGSLVAALSGDALLALYQREFLGPP
ncbi:MAG: A24 family peptidase [Candidatus Eisenbacteria bacterium]|nr:A24 family peptidase [Candidatus Eisenbacteria bacterium]